MNKIKHDICTVVGNRPQFIKMAPVSKALAERGAQELIIHSGQHFDPNMSEIFFQEMQIPKPHVFLDVANRTHAGMTGELIIAFEKIFLEQEVKKLLIYGDTNTTLAAALTAVKLGISIAHIEAGPRIYDMSTPEEINRIVADNCSKLLFCPEIVSVQNLAKEGITKGVFLTGDVMLDAFIHFSDIAKTKNSIIEKHALKQVDFSLLTIHRPNNTDRTEDLLAIIALIKNIHRKVVFAIHPRTENAFRKNNLWDTLKALDNLIVVPPLGYLDILSLLNACVNVYTDSGGLQKEAFFANKPCHVLFYITPWPLIEKTGMQKVIGCVKDISTFVEIASSGQHIDKIFGEGNAAHEIVQILERERWY
jgi:UDP-GlcNAc3NAcA epimerase